MYKDCMVELSMVRVILGDGYFDNSVYNGKIIRYIPDKECIYLLVESADLPAFSLDALYECRILNDKEMLKCQGFIRERYNNKLGKTIVFVIQNGFYKNPVN